MSKSPRVRRQIRAFKSPTTAALVAAAGALLTPGVALANGGDFHFGAIHVGMPAGVVYALAGFVGAVMLFFVANWARYKRAQSRGGAPRRSRRSQMRDEEEEDVTGREAN
ncbi:MAG TPA: hypothetical protein VJA25_13525 [Dehalococcoidia bacterium]|nr:hypothetical protein [Dehalococcoidia bacterium]